MNNKTRYQKRLGQFVMAGLMTGLGTYASANDYSLTSNNFVIKNGADEVASATLASNGILGTATLPQINVDSTTLDAGLPSFSFNLASAGLVNNTSHTFRVGLSISDNADPDNRRFEAFIATLTLNVDGNGVVTGTIPNQDMSVAAKKGSSTFSVAISNPSTNGPVSISGGTLSFSGNDAVARLRARNNTAINTILDNFALNGTFTFRVVVQEVSRSGTGVQAARVGVTSGTTFTALPRIATTCEANPSGVLGNLFKLLTGTGFTNAYAVQGQFRAGTGGTANTLQAFTESCAVVADTTVNETATAANAVNTAITSGTTADAQTALGSVLTSLTTIGTSVGTGATLSAAQQTQIQSNVEAVFSNIETLLNNVAGNQAALAGVVEQLNGILAALSTSGVPATATLVNRVVTAGQVAARAEARRGLPATATEADVQAALLTNPAALENAIKASLRIPRITVAPPSTVTGTTFTQVAGTNGISAGGCSGDQLLAATLNPGTPACGSATALSSLSSDGVTAEILALSAADIKISSDTVTGITTIELPGESYSGLVTAIRAVPAEVPNVIRIQRDGTAVIIGNGYAIEIAPAALNVTGFVSAVAAAGFTNQSLSETDAGFRIELGGGERFAGVFAYNNLTGQTLNTNCGAVTIVEPTIAPTAPDYGFGVNCANGVQQLIVPHVDNTSFYASLDAANISYQVDRNTGFIMTGTTGTFKPSFFISPLTAADQTYHAANKDALGIAYQAIDVNGDGIMDYKVIAPNGTQVLYGVK